MSDEWGGPGWWIGGDGRWHPPRNSSVRRKPHLEDEASENSFNEVVRSDSTRQSAPAAQESDVDAALSQGRTHADMNESNQGPSEQETVDEVLARHAEPDLIEVPDVQNIDVEASPAADSTTGQVDEQWPVIDLRKVEQTRVRAETQAA